MLNSLTMAMWLDAGSGHDVYVARIFLGVIAIALVAQAVGVIVVGVFAARLLHRVDGIASSMEEKTAPILAKTNELLHDLSPKVRSITENIDQIGYTVRARVDEVAATVQEINVTVQDLNARTRMQVARADYIVTDAMAATEDISRTVQDGIRAPIRQVVGIIAGLKAGLETLAAHSPWGKGSRPGPYDL